MAKQQTSGAKQAAKAAARVPAARSAPVRAGAPEAAPKHAPPTVSEAERLRRENARLRQENARLKADAGAVALSGDVRYDKSYHVEPYGAKAISRGLIPATVAHCCDAGEAMRLYFARNGITDTHHYTLRVTEVVEDDWSEEGDVHATADPEMAVRPEPYLTEDGDERKDADAPPEDKAKAAEERETV